MRQQLLIDDERARGYAMGVLRSISIDEPLLVTVETYRERRSVEQNSRYWAILRDIAEQCKPQGVAYSSETWHKYFAAKWIGVDEIKLPNGRTITEPKSTTKLKVDEFNEYMTRIEAWAVEHGVILSLET